MRLGGARTDALEQRRAAGLVRRYGAPALLLSWVPIVGDGLVLVAGAVRMPFGRFLLCTAIGKVLRYIAVTWLVTRA